MKKGQLSPLRGKTLEEIHGIEKANVIRQNTSKKLRGHKSWNKGQRRSQQSIERYIATRKANKEARTNGEQTKEERDKHEYISQKNICSVGHVISTNDIAWCKHCASLGYGRIYNRADEVWQRAKFRAKASKSIFTITRRDVIEVWPDDNKCPITLLNLLSCSEASKEKGKALLSSPSLDKIIPELGYVKNNVAILSNQANAIKSNCIDPEVFQRLAIWLREKINAKNSHN